MIGRRGFITGLLIVAVGILSYGIAEGLNTWQGITQQSARDRQKNLQAKYDSWGVYMRR